MAGHGQSIASWQRIRAREREAEALRLKKAGETYERIGERLGISHEGARKAVLRALDRLTQPAAEAVRCLAGERYEEMYRALRKGIEAGNPRAIEVATKVIAQQARILGYVAKPQDEAAVEGGLSIHIHTNLEDESLGRRDG